LQVKSDDVVWFCVYLKDGHDRSVEKNTILYFGYHCDLVITITEGRTRSTVDSKLLDPSVNRHESSDLDFVLSRCFKKPAVKRTICSYAVAKPSSAP